MRKIKRYIAAALAVLSFGSAGAVFGAGLPPGSASAAAGFTPVISYFPVLSEAAAATLPELIPVASNHPLDADHKGLTRAIVVIHDASRDAGDVLSAAMALAGTANATVMIVAPQFLIESDMALFSERLPDHGHAFARWPLGQWEQGGDSAVLAQKNGVSSFTALDLLLSYLGDKKFFPDLRQIVIAGNGAGANFILRYAAAGRAIDALEKDGTPVRFVAANASSYLYSTPTRANTNKPGFSIPDAKSCANFNAWPYGLDNLNAYAAKTGANAIKLTAPLRNVAYLVSLPAAGDGGADGSCAAMLEGADASHRALNYNMYLSLMYGEARKTQYFAPLIKGSGVIALFGSPCGMTQLFGNGNCESSGITSAKIPQ